MTSFGIQPPGPSRCPSPLFLQAVLKVAGQAPVSCGFLGIANFGISGFLWTQGLSPPAYTVPAVACQLLLSVNCSREIWRTKSTSKYLVAV